MFNFSSVFFILLIFFILAIIIIYSLPYIPVIPSDQSFMLSSSSLPSGILKFSTDTTFYFLQYDGTSYFVHIFCTVVNPSGSPFISKFSNFSIPFSPRSLFYISDNSYIFLDHYIPDRNLWSISPVFASSSEVPFIIWLYPRDQFHLRANLHFSNTSFLPGIFRFRIVYFFRIFPIFYYSTFFDYSNNFIISNSINSSYLTIPEVYYD